MLSTVAATLESGVVLLDDENVVLANEAARALRVVSNNRLTARPLVRLARENLRAGLTPVW